MREFRDLFEAYGANYQATIDRFLGNEKMYLRFLELFFQDESLKKLGEALNAGDLTAAFEAAHTLKGVAANMGLTPLYDAVCAIVEPLRGKEKCSNYPALYQRIQLEYQRVKDLWVAWKGGEAV